MTKYDDASWHYGGDYPSDLPPAAAATHIGVFVSWCVLAGMTAGDLAEDDDEIERLTDRDTTPGRFLIEACDEKFVSDDLTAEGNRFTLAYYQGKRNDPVYVRDFLECLDCDHRTIYAVPDTWATYDALAPRISARYAAWVSAGRPKYVLAGDPL